MKKLLALLLALALLAPVAAEAAPPKPFGHACTPLNGVVFCPTSDDAQRVPSWDGVPLDVDVTLPPKGNGPFPAIVMMHGWGGSKGNFEADTPAGRSSSDWHYNNNFFAKRGYAVINASARGFGRSCGAMDSRTSPGCDRGWVRLADHRYEGRDVQYLLGLLVDQGVVNPDEIGVTGISYGGIQSLNLARLRDRIRLPNGSYKPWRSPKGTKLSIAAAYPRWGGSDMTYALQPNGRFLDFRPYRVGQSNDPSGVQKQSYVSALYGAGAGTGFYATAGAPFSANLPLWKQLTDAGEPVTAQGLRAGRELTNNHSIAGLTGVPAPMLVENGWTDDLFPAEEALRVWRIFHGVKGARVSLQLGDLGHPRGANITYSDHVSTRRAPASSPPTSRATAAARARARRTCSPRSARGTAGAAPSTARRAGRRCTPAPPDSVRTAPRRSRRPGGDPAIAAAINPIGGKDPCLGLDAARAPAHRGRPAQRRQAVHDDRPADGAGPDRHDRARRDDRGAPVGRPRRHPGARLARHLPAAGQPEGEGRLPAVRKRLEVRPRPHGQARAARQRRELRAQGQLRLLGAGVQAVGEPSDIRSRSIGQRAQIR